MGVVAVAWVGQRRDDVSKGDDSGADSQAEGDGDQECQAEGDEDGTPLGGAGDHPWFSARPCRQYPMKATLRRSRPWSLTRVRRMVLTVADSPASQA